MPSAVAIHEAAHAVLAFLHDLPVAHVCITPDDESDGHMVHGEIEHLDQLLEQMSANAFDMAACEPGPGRCARNMIEAQVMGLIAGRLAEILAGHDGGGAEDDYRRAAIFAERATGDEEEQAAYLAWLEARTRNTLRGAWPMVEALAVALDERHALEGDEAAEIAFAPMRR